MAVHRYPRLIGLLALIFFPFLFETLRAQGVAREGAVCQPASQRTQELGCWILADDSVGQLTKPQVFWHLETYPTVAAAQADKGSRGIVLDSFGKIWLMTIGYEKSTTTHGSHIADIGPIPITAGKQYSAQFMEAIFTPGMMAPEHLHSGPEAWFTLAGQTCLETSDGNVQVGRAGGPPVIVPEGLSMHLTATGTELRKALVLILHDSSKPPSTTVHEWTAKGLCKNKE